MMCLVANAPLELCFSVGIIPLPFLFMTRFNTRNYNSFFCYLLRLCIVVKTFFVETWGLPSYRLYTLLLGTRGFSYI